MPTVIKKKKSKKKGKVKGVVKIKKTKVDPDEINLDDLKRQLKESCSTIRGMLSEMRTIKVDHHSVKQAVLNKWVTFIDVSVTQLEDQLQALES